MNEKKIVSKYWCFISYSHTDNKSPDRKWASWLHSEIEQFNVPSHFVGKTNERGQVIPRRIYPIFRDETSLPANASLSDAITSALDNSAFLIVICSENAKKSKYVSEEIEYFKKTHGDSNIIAAIISGEPSTEAKGAFPKVLTESFDSEGNLNNSKFIEPLAADFRLVSGEEGYTNPQRYKRHLLQSQKNRIQVRREAVGRVMDRGVDIA